MVKVLGKDGFYGWIALVVTAVLGVVGAGGMFYSFGAFLPKICGEFGWSRAIVSGALTIFVVMVSVSAPLVGFFVGKYGPRKALVIGNTLGTAGLLLLAVHKELWQFYVAYGLLIGSGVGLGGFIAATTIANNWFKRKAPLAVGIVVGAQGLGGIVIVPIIVPIIENVGWRHSYEILAGLVFVFAVLLPAFFLRNKPEDLGQVPDGISTDRSDKAGSMIEKDSGQGISAEFSAREALGTRAFWLLVILNNSIVFILTMLMAHQIAFLQGIGLSAAIAGILMGLISGTSTFGNLLMGFLALKFNLKTLTLIGTLLMVLSMVLVILTGSLPMAVAYTVVFGFGYGISWVGMTSLISAYFGRSNYPKILGNAMIFSAIGNIGAPVAGIIFDTTRSYHTAFLVGLVIAVIAFLCIAVIKAPVHPSLRQ